MEKKNVVIFVAGQRFSLSTADSEEYVVSIGERVENMINGIQRENPRFNRDTCATLVALDLCDDETKLRQMLEVLREQVKDYLRDGDNLRSENTKLKQEIKELKARLKELEKKTETKTEAATQKADKEAVYVQPKANTPTTVKPSAVSRDNSDKKKKRHNHNHQNPFKEKHAQQNAVKSDTSAPIGDIPEDLPFPDEPYQFNIFDTLE